MSGVDKLTDAERREIGDVLGRVVMYFVAEAAGARRDRDDWQRRADEAEAALARYRSGVLVTDLAVQP